MRKNLTYDKEFFAYLICFLVVILVVCFFPYIFTRKPLPIFIDCLDFTNTGAIGDTIGGIMGPFVAIIAAGLTFMAFWVQYKANIQQRHDIAIERFESNLFEMIHIQQEIINGLLIEELNSGRSQKGRDVFQFVYEAARIVKLKKYSYSTTLRYALEESDDYKKELSDIRHIWFLDHYFRHLYRIFKYIDDADEDIVDRKKKYSYACIVRATLSQYELVMLFYNGFSHQKFKGLIERYAILNNLRIDLLASKNDQRLYTEKISETYNVSNERNSKEEYKQSAFKFQKDS